MVEISVWCVLISKLHIHTALRPRSPSPTGNEFDHHTTDPIRCRGAAFVRVAHPTNLGRPKKNSDAFYSTQAILEPNCSRKLFSGKLYRRIIMFSDIKRFRSAMFIAIRRAVTRDVASRKYCKYPDDGLFLN